MARKLKNTKEAKRQRQYKEVSCHSTKSAATKKAKSMRNGGATAQVIKKKTKTGTKYCIKSAGQRKTVTLKTGQKLSGVRKKRKTTRKNRK